MIPNPTKEQMDQFRERTDFIAKYLYDIEVGYFAKYNDDSQICYSIALMKCSLNLCLNLTANKPEMYDDFKSMILDVFDSYEKNYNISTE